MNFYSFFFLTFIAVVALAAPQGPRIIEKTTIIRGGGPDQFGGAGQFGQHPGFAQGPYGGSQFGQQYGPGFGGARQPTIIKETIIRG